MRERDRETERETERGREGRSRERRQGEKILFVIGLLLINHIFENQVIF